MEQQIENINLEFPVIVKRGRGRPFKIKVPVVDVIPKERKPRGPKPTPTGSVLDPDYFNRYYHVHLSQLTRCDKCGSCVTKQQIKNHQKSARCVKIALVPFVENLFKPL